MGVFKCSGPSLSVSVNGNNQVSGSGFSYDADGEMTNDANYTYAFNGASEITSANGVNYTYDGDGLRVAKSSGTLYWRAYTGQVIEETDTSGNATTDYIFFDGSRIAWWSSTGNSIENAGFESGNTGWSLGATYSIVDNASNAHSGSWYLSSSGSSNDQWAVATGTNGSAWVPVKPGQVITWGGWIKRTGGTGILDWGCETVDASYNLTGWCGHFWAAGKLSYNIGFMAAKFPNFTATQNLQAAAAAYNFGVQNISGNPATIDVGTTGDNYGSDILLLMDCYDFYF